MRRVQQELMGTSNSPHEVERSVNPNLIGKSQLIGIAVSRAHRSKLPRCGGDAATDSTHGTPLHAAPQAWRMTPAHIHRAGTVVSTFHERCPEYAIKGLARVIDLSCFGQSPAPI